MSTLTAIKVIVLLDALLMAVGHVPIIRAIFHSFPIGVYFLFATVVYAIGGILVVSERLFKLANVSLIVLAIIDNLLLIYTRTMPNIFFPRVLPWSSDWFPPRTLQILVGQCIIIVLCAVLLYKPKTQL